MTLCDKCKKEVARFNLTLLRKEWRRDGVEEICRECTEELEQKIEEVGARYRALRAVELSDWWGQELATTQEAKA